MQQIKCKHNALIQLIKEYLSYKKKKCSAIRIRQKLDNFFYVKQLHFNAVIYILK